MLIVNILIYLLIVALALWLVVYLVGIFGPAEFQQPARVVCGVIFLIIAIYALMSIIGGVPFQGPRLLHN